MSELNKEAKFRGEYGYYENLGRRYGGGKIVLSKGSYSIWFEKQYGAADVTMLITKKEVKSDYTMYFSRNSQLVIFKGEVYGGRKHQQIQFKRYYDANTKLFSLIGAFQTSVVLTGTEAIAAEKLRKAEEAKQLKIAAEYEAERVASEKIYDVRQQANRKVADSLAAVYAAVKAKRKETQIGNWVLPSGTIPVSIVDDSVGLVQFSVRINSRGRVVSASKASGGISKAQEKLCEEALLNTNYVYAYEIGETLQIGASGYYNFNIVPARVR